MQLLIKHLSLVLATLLLMSIVSVSIADPTDEMRSLVVTADYHPININKASASEIAEAMRGVGYKTATAIVAYRKANGPFKAVDDLMAVKGVGARTLAKNERVIALE
jgi:competence protein ComEA